MKKSMKSILAKSLAVTLAFGLAGIAPNTSSDAASKKPTVTKKVTVTVGKTKTVKVKSKKKVKKTTWSLNKKGKKIVSLSKKKKTSVKVKGKKAGKATLTAKIKVGKKTYKKTCKITVKKAVVKPTPNTGKVTPTPNNNTNNATPTPGGSSSNATPTPGSNKVGTFKVGDANVTVDESATYPITISDLNEVTWTSESKRPDTDPITDGKGYNRDGSVSFTSLKDYNSGVCFYINPCTDESQLVVYDEETGRTAYRDGAKDMSAYDYIRVNVTCENELNLRTYNGSEQFESAGFPGSSSSETYEATWVHTDEKIWAEEKTFSAGETVKSEYATRTIFIPLSAVVDKGCDLSTLTAIGMCPQGEGVECKINFIDFVKVKYDTKVSAINVTAKKTEVAPGKATSVAAEITPENATRKIVKWSSSDEEIATVNFAGSVTAKKEGTVTITATATDGSDVSGSVQITVKEPSDVPAVIETHKFDLSKVVAKTNPGAGESVAAIQSATKIEFAKKGSMTFVNFADYLAENGLDLADYDELRVTWNVCGADGSAVTDYGAAEGAPTYGKIAYAAAANLNGYGDGIDVSYTGEGDTEVNKSGLAAPYTGQTCTLTIANTNKKELSTVDGFNLQLQSLPDDMYIVISDITLYKNNDINVDLSKVVAKTNPGEGEGVVAENTADGLKFTAGGNMLYIDMSTLLADIDLTTYTQMKVDYQLKKADGTNADAYDEAPGWGNFALVKKADLNGYTNPGLLKGTLGNMVSDTAVFDLTKLESASAVDVAGFNMQLEKCDKDKYIVITGITIVK